MRSDNQLHPSAFLGMFMLLAAMVFASILLGLTAAPLFSGV